MEDDPFVGLSIASDKFLDEMDGRSTCPKCGKSRKFFCYTCYVPVQGIEDKVPKVQLPFKVDIIKHPNECDGKSTSAHAGVIAPDDVTIYTFPCIPDYDPEKVVLLFPGDNSLSMEELSDKIKDKHIKESHKAEELSQEGGKHCIKKESFAHSSSVLNTQAANPDAKGSNNSTISQPINGLDIDKHTEKTIESLGKRKHESDNSEYVIRDSDIDSCEHCDEPTPAKKQKEDSKIKAPFERAVFIDSTWNQTKRISSDERLKGLQRVELKTRQSQFWRHQKDIPSTYLSTIEAIYYFVRDYHDLFVNSHYEGDYDNLLFFFTFMYRKIKGMYKGGQNLKAYKQRSNNKDATDVL